ncbi:MAG: hypothetical protein F6K11_02475 [Leptolyngbya sp. SIO3F4]|nr:hypothetical protein [Leptolyngbya sp. SIO3F4]
MKSTRARAAVVANRSIKSRQSQTWVQTVSGITLLAVGLQGTAADAVGDWSSQSLDGQTELENTGFAEAVGETNPEIVAPVKPEMAQPRFTQLRMRFQTIVNSEVSETVDESPTNGLENHRRELHRRSNAVELKLLELQQLLSLQAYGTSFADRLLEEDGAYQAKLQELRSLEAKFHRALEQTDRAALRQLRYRLQQIDQELLQQAQVQLQQYVAAAQMTSTLGLWQEPMYRESLRWLMEHTHERHLLQARQQMLASTVVAMTVD